MKITELLAELERRCVHLEVRAGKLRFHPLSAVPPELVVQMKAHKNELLAILKPKQAGITPENSDADPFAFWEELTDDSGIKILVHPEHLEDQYSDPPDPCKKCGGLMFWWNVLNQQRCMRCDPSTVSDRLLEFVARKRRTEKEQFKPIPSNAICPCGSTRTSEVAIHNGRSIRIDCFECGRFIDFLRWHADDGEKYDCTESLRTIAKAIDDNTTRYLKQAPSALSSFDFGGVWQNIMAGLIPLWVNGCPAFVPQIVVMQSGQRHHGFCVGFVPASTSAFYSLSRTLTLRFCRPGTNLPVLESKLWVADHVTSFSRVLNQPIGRSTLVTTKGLAPSG